MPYSCFAANAHQFGTGRVAFVSDVGREDSPAWSEDLFRSESRRVFDDVMNVHMAAGRLVRVWIE